MRVSEAKNVDEKEGARALRAYQPGKVLWP